MENKKQTPIIIAWEARYSTTMQEDKQGRWARIAYSGNFDGGIGFYKNKVSRFEIAWVKKFNHPKTGTTLYNIQPEFPFKGKYVHDTLKEAQKEVEKEFRWFINMILKSGEKPKNSLKIGK